MTFKAIKSQVARAEKAGRMACSPGMSRHYAPVEPTVEIGCVCVNEFHGAGDIGDTGDRVPVKQVGRSEDSKNITC